MIQIAIYGKGGIGKSTVSANISYSLAEKGRKVLQIGCDPKRDSTRALVGGRAQTPVLNYIRCTPPHERRLGDIVLDGAMGVKCVEAGGPEPGIGCAGRGILSTFETLKRLGLNDMDFDVKIYDVLGDVVCGGFAVPLRNEYADGVYLVTSGEFMSMYAANNILRGMTNFDKGVPRVAGIILNRRGVEGEREAVERFADAVGLPVVACVPRSGLFAEAEAAGRTVMEMFPGSDAAGELRKASESIIGIIGRASPLYYPAPLDDAQMERVARGLAAGAAGSAAPAVAATCRACPREARGKVTTEGNIITSCALAGAVQGCSSVTDAIVVIHGPRSCAHIMSSLRNISEIIRGASKAGNLQSMRMVSTDIDDTVSVFGGAGLLEEKVREAVMGGHRNIFVVTSCVPGIIGDNTIDVVNAISLEHPDVYLRVVEADGNITGDWNEGFVQSADALLDMVDGSVGPEADAANILAERYFYKRGEDKESAVVELFRHYGIRVNCRFMYESDMDSVRNFRKGRVSYLIDNDRSSLEVADLVEGRLGVRVDRDPLPVGMEEHRRFSERIGEEFGIAERAGRAFAELEGRYKAAIEGIRPRLEGKRALIENRFLQDIDWLLDLLADLGVEVVAIEVGPLHPWKDRGPPPRRLSERTRIRYDYTLADMTSDVEELSPDIVLSDAVLTDVGNAYHTTFSRPGPGLDGIIGFARRLGDIVRAPMREGWRDAA